MEIWKDIQGYEGLYQVSNLGNIRSLNRILKDRNGREVNRRSKEIKQNPNTQGYLRVQLKKQGTQKYYFVHRLVAYHFVENPMPERYTVVNHLDFNYLNNKANNLEWTTIAGNNHYSFKRGRMKRTKEWLQHLRESNEKQGKSVIGTNIATGETIRFVCLNDCRSAGFQPSCVCNCCKGKTKTHKGYTWRYEQ